MTVRGNIFKETAKFSYKKNSTFVAEPLIQIEALKQILHKAKKTEFGKLHNFDKILTTSKINTEFSQFVPLTNYDTFYHNWLKFVLQGKKNIIWPGKINHFALTSGTTTGSSKRIPVSSESIKQFQQSSFKQVATLHDLDLPDSFYNSSILTIGGSTELKKINNHYEGDLSGILQKHNSILLRPFTKPSKSIAKETDWDVKIDRIIEKAPNWDIGGIAGVPTWILKLLEKIVDHYQLEYIQDIWPNFNLFLHGGIHLTNYQQRIQKLSKNKIHFIDTYLASEGYFAYQRSPQEKGMQLLVDNGIYFEFVEEKFFDALRNLQNHQNIPTLNLSQVVENKKYALVITTSSGLYRYIVGDVVRFIDKEKHLIEIVGRVSQTLSVAGEHLSLSELTTAVHKVSKTLGVAITEFCVIPSKNGKRHLWYIGSENPINNNIFEVYLDRELEILNDDYRCSRRYHLKKPKVKIIGNHFFHGFMKKRGKLGSQNKFPRVMSTEQGRDWNEFLNEGEGELLAS